MTLNLLCKIKANEVVFDRANDIALRLIHFPSCVMLDIAVGFA